MGELTTFAVQTGGFHRTFEVLKVGHSRHARPSCWSLNRTVVVLKVLVSRARPERADHLNRTFLALEDLVHLPERFAERT